MSAKKPSRAEVEALAKAKGVRVEKSIIGTIRNLDKRETNDRRAAQRTKQIKDIF